MEKVMQIRRWILTIRNKLLLISLSFQLTWFRFSSRRAKMQKSELLLIYAFVILLLGIGLGMIWHAHQVEIGRKAEMTAPSLNLYKATLDPWRISFSYVTIGMKQD